MLPFFMLAMYEKHGQPLEKIVGNILKVAVIRPKQRPYQTNNFYAVLKRQMCIRDRSIRNCLTVFQRDPLLSGAIAYNILTDRKDIIKPIGFHRESTALNLSLIHILPLLRRGA